MAYEITTTKTDNVRTIVPACDVLAMLRGVKLQQKHSAQAAGAAWDNPHNLVFTNELGRHLLSHSVYKSFKRFVDKLELPHLRFHDTRHTYATNSISWGVPHKVVQENLGHANISTTLNTYAHVTPEMQRDSADKMQQLIDRAKAG